MSDSTSRTAPRGRSPRDIREEIERTRADMDETVDALRDRFTPGSVVDEVWQSLRGDGGVGETLRDHAVPLAFMGVGLGWLAIEEATDSSGGRAAVSRARSMSGTDDGEPKGAAARAKARGAASSASEKASAAKEKASAAKEKIGGTMDSARSRASGAAREASETAGQMKRKASRTAERAGEGTRKAAARARDGVSNLGRSMAETAKENPLAAGAAALGLGLIGGLALPTSRTEDRTMGPVADTVKDESGRLARETAESAAEVAGETASAVRAEASAQAERGDDALETLEEAAREVADSAAETASEKTREATDSLQEEGRRAAERTREAAEDDREGSGPAGRS